ncbi:MAG: hypothetical protein ACMG6E_07620, partial [Candidatus Roizmanbacteria bacterium]
MKVPLNLLKQFVKIPDDIKEISSVFTSLGYMLDGQAKETEDDIVLDLEVRQNRADCFCIIGLARELAAYYHKKVILPNLDRSV